MREKCVLHMDGDAFFVAVEVAKNPRLRGLPVVTGEEKGIVSALSYEAKALGIIRGMPIFRVRKEFPRVIILPGDYKSYVRYSEKMFDIVRRYADDVEEYSIDECFADLTGLDRPLKMSYKEIGEKIKEEIVEELDLSISIGIAPTKCLAKVASKWIKPNGFTIINKSSISDFLLKIPIGKIWGIGHQTSIFLNKKGIENALQFIQKDREWVNANLEKPYETIWYELQGTPVMEVDSKIKTLYSSMQRTRSFHPSTNNEVFLLSQLSKHVEDVCVKARHYDLVTRRFSFFIKTKDFRYISYTLSLPSATNTPEAIVSLIQNNFNKIYDKGFVYRTTGVTLHELIPSSHSHTDLFGISDKTNKFEVIHNKIDEIEDKYGKSLVYLASTHHARSRDVKGTDNDDLDRNLLFL
jgi:DNA polymerase-4/DNA polymerase V